jgi:hypothetical protein
VSRNVGRCGGGVDGGGGSQTVTDTTTSRSLSLRVDGSDSSSNNTQDGGTHGLWRERCIRTAAGSSRATTTPPGGDLLEAPCEGDGGAGGVLQVASALR